MCLVRQNPGTPRQNALGKADLERENEATVDKDLLSTKARKNSERMTKFTASGTKGSVTKETIPKL